MKKNCVLIIIRENKIYIIGGGLEILIFKVMEGLKFKRLSVG